MISSLRGPGLAGPLGHNRNSSRGLEQGLFGVTKNLVKQNGELIKQNGLLVAQQGSLLDLFKGAPSPSTKRRRDPQKGQRGASRASRPVYVRHCVTVIDNNLHDDAQVSCVNDPPPPSSVLFSAPMDETPCSPPSPPATSPPSSMLSPEMVTTAACRHATESPAVLPPSALAANISVPSASALVATDLVPSSATPRDPILSMITSNDGRIIRFSIPLHGNSMPVASYASRMFTWDGNGSEVCVGNLVRCQPRVFYPDACIDVTYPLEVVAFVAHPSLPAWIVLRPALNGTCDDTAITSRTDPQSRTLVAALSVHFEVLSTSAADDDASSSMKQAVLDRDGNELHIGQWVAVSASSPEDRNLVADAIAAGGPSSADARFEYPREETAAAVLLLGQQGGRGRIMRMDTSRRVVAVTFPALQLSVFMKARACTIIREDGVEGITTAASPEKESVEPSGHLPDGGATTTTNAGGLSLESSPAVNCYQGVSSSSAAQESGEHSDEGHRPTSPPPTATTAPALEEGAAQESNFSSLNAIIGDCSEGAPTLSERGDVTDAASVEMTTTTNNNNTTVSAAGRATVTSTVRPSPVQDHQEPGAQDATFPSPSSSATPPSSSSPPPRVCRSPISLSSEQPVTGAGGGATTEMDNLRVTDDMTTKAPIALPSPALAPHPKEMKDAEAGNQLVAVDPAPIELQQVQQQPDVAAALPATTPSRVDESTVNQEGTTADGLESLPADMLDFLNQAPSDDTDPSSAGEDANEADPQENAGVPLQAATLTSPASVDGQLLPLDDAVQQPQAAAKISTPVPAATAASWPSREGVASTDTDDLVGHFGALQVGSRGSPRAAVGGGGASGRRITNTTTHGGASAACSEEQGELHNKRPSCSMMSASIVGHACSGATLRARTRPVHGGCGLQGSTQASSSSSCPSIVLPAATSGSLAQQQLSSSGQQQPFGTGASGVMQQQQQQPVVPAPTPMVVSTPPQEHRGPSLGVGDGASGTTTTTTTAATMMDVVAGQQLAIMTAGRVQQVVPLQHWPQQQQQNMTAVTAAAPPVFMAAAPVPLQQQQQQAYTPAVNMTAAVPPVFMEAAPVIQQQQQQQQQMVVGDVPQATSITTTTVLLPAHPSAMPEQVVFLPFLRRAAFHSLNPSLAPFCSKFVGEKLAQVAPESLQSLMAVMDKPFNVAQVFRALGMVKITGTASKEIQAVVQQSLLTGGHHANSVMVPEEKAAGLVEGMPVRFQSDLVDAAAEYWDYVSINLADVGITTSDTPLLLQMLRRHFRGTFIVRGVQHNGNSSFMVVRLKGVQDAGHVLGNVIVRADMIEAIIEHDRSGVLDGVPAVIAANMLVNLSDTWESGDTSRLPQLLLQQWLGDDMGRLERLRVDNLDRYFQVMSVSDDGAAMVEVVWADGGGGEVYRLPVSVLVPALVDDGDDKTVTTLEQQQQQQDGDDDSSRPWAATLRVGQEVMVTGYIRRMAAAGLLDDVKEQLGTLTPEELLALVPHIHTPFTVESVVPDYTPTLLWISASTDNSQEFIVPEYRLVMTVEESGSIVPCEHVDFMVGDIVSFEVDMWSAAVKHNLAYLASHLPDVRNDLLLALAVHALDEFVVHQVVVGGGGGVHGNDQGGDLAYAASSSSSSSLVVGLVGRQDLNDPLVRLTVRAELMTLVRREEDGQHDGPAYGGGSNNHSNHDDSNNNNSNSNNSDNNSNSNNQGGRGYGDGGSSSSDLLHFHVGALVGVVNVWSPQYDGPPELRAMVSESVGSDFKLLGHLNEDWGAFRLVAIVGDMATVQVDQVGNTGASHHVFTVPSAALQDPMVAPEAHDVEYDDDDALGFDNMEDFF